MSRNTLFLLIFFSGGAIALGQENFGSSPDFGNGSGVNDLGEDTDLFGPANADLGDDDGLQNATPSNSIDEVNPTGNGNNQDQYNESPDNDYGYGSTESANANDNNIGNKNTNPTVAPGYNNTQGTNTQGVGSVNAQGGQGAPVQGTQYQASPVLNQQQTPGNLLNETFPQQTSPNALLQQTIPSQIVGQGTNADLVNPVQQPEVPATDAAPFDVVEETVPNTPPLPLPNEFSGAPSVPGTLRNMADGEAPEEYFVQHGDTLFDIVDQLLDEPGYWPKLWSLNPEIKNPHFIWPGMKLQFYPGDDQSPPYLQIVSEEDVIPIDAGNLVAQELVEEPIQEVVDLDNVTPTEVIGPEDLVIPDELADLFVYGGKIYDGSQAVVTVPGFLYKGEPKQLATVVFGREGELKSGPDKLVFIRRTGGVEEGGKYSVIRRVQEVSRPGGDGVIGTLYYFVAHAQVLRNLKDNISVMQVADSYRDVSPEDLVVEYISTKRTVPDLARVGATSESSGAVVYFNTFEQSFGGIGDFVFLGGGTYQKDQFVGVNGTSGFVFLPFTVGDLPEDYRSVGVVRIVDTTDAGAVGIIVQAQREIRIGDRIGG